MLRLKFIMKIKIILRLKDRIIDYINMKKSIFDFKELSKEIKGYRYDIRNDNYGILYSLKKYSNYKKVSNVSVEHGFYLGDFIYNEDTLIKK